MPDSHAPLAVRLIDEPGLGPVAVLTLEQGDRPVVVIDESLVGRLDKALATLPSDLAGFVMESAAPRAFVAGADLKAIMAMDDRTLHQYLEAGAAVFQRIADLPCPTVAAIHGACLGGGFELAAHCDALVAVVDPEARPYPIGLPEAGLKICPGWGGTNLLPARIDPEQAIVATANGVPFRVADAHQLGMFDAICTTREDLVSTGIAWIKDQRRGHTDAGTPMHWIGTDEHYAEVERGLDVARAKLEPSPHADAVLECVRVGLKEGWKSALQKERDELVRLRSTPAAREAIESFFAKSAKPKQTS